MTKIVTVAGAPGDPSVFGNSVWNMYGYKGADITLATATYTGYYVQNELSFNTQSGSTAWNSDYSPSTSSGWNGCTLPNDNFTFVHKRKGFPCGNYTVTMTNWDDSCVIYINGVQQWYCQNWSYPGSCNGYVGVFALNENSTIEVRTSENGGGAHAGISLVNNSTASSAPTSIDGGSVICRGNTMVLTAAGGTAGTDSSYQWGTGSVPGTNIISGQTGVSITVSPTVPTTYWVRRFDGGPCAAYTAAVSQLITIQESVGNPAVFGDNVWNAYGYNRYDLSLGTTVYAGYYTQSTLGFDTRTGVNSWAITSAPDSATGWTGCALDNEKFTFVYKRKGFPCGNYTVKMTNWDDDCVVYIDGVQQWYCPNWSEVGGCNGYVGEFMLNESTEIEIRIAEIGGVSFGALSLVNNSPSITGSVSPSSTLVCGNSGANAITLSGNSGNIIKWQSADDAAFTSGVTDINTTASVLTAAQIGSVTTTKYFRAVLEYGTCQPQYTTPVVIQLANPVLYNGSGFSGTPSASTPLIVESNLTINADLHVCSCLVKNGATVTVSPSASLIVENSVDVEPSAALNILNTGSLVQVDDQAINTGVITMHRNTQPMKLYDYTYWAAPVSNWSLAQLSTFTLYDKFFSFDPIVDDWSLIMNGAEEMVAGKGYIVRAPQGWSISNATSGVYSGMFYGKPNSGLIQTTLKKGIGYYNLIGNPYPSAIDIDSFITDPANSGIVQGTIYLWTHNTAISNLLPGPAVYNYTKDDYAKYNLTGGVRSGDPAITGGPIPDGKVAAGQGFFIGVNEGLPNGNYTATFRNSMRVANHNDKFYRTSPANGTTINKSRFWLTIRNQNGAYNEMLVGYVDGATNGFDILYDGETLPAGNVISLYSIGDTHQYSIQGRAVPFDPNDSIPLGYKSTITGSFTIALDHFDGVLASENVYLVDNLLEVTHDLKESNYDFITAAGTFNDRFQIKYVNTVLGTNPDIKVPASVVVASSNGQVEAIASETIREITIFDVLGRKVYSNTVNDTHFKSSGLALPTGMLVVKIKLDNNVEVSHKVLIN